jgi:restriction endonuclease S subunit
MSKKNWLETTIGELIAQYGGEIKTGPFGTALKASEYSDKGVPVIAVREIGLGNLSITKNTPYVDKNVTDRLSEYLVKEGDIVFGRKGAVDRSARIKFEQDGWFLGSDCIRLRLPNNCDPRFVQYHFLTEDHRQWMHQQATGTTMASLNQKIISRISLSLPPIDEQRAIARVLGALDDKIELNRQMNQTLETMAQALFKSWFVDFDPVVAKVEGRKPFGMSDEVAALFPDRFEDSELGPIPKGWRVESVGNSMEILDSKRIPLSGAERLKMKGTIPYYGAATLMDYINNYIFDGIYLLLAEDGSVITKDETPVLQYVWGKLWVNNHAHVIQGRFPISTEHLFLFFKNTKILPCVTGAIQLKINQENLKKISFLRPTNELARQFQQKTDYLFEEIRTFSEEINSLIQLRDILLPKLFSGEIRVEQNRNYSSG